MVVERKDIVKAAAWFLICTLIEAGAFVLTFHSRSFNDIGWHIFFGLATLMFLGMTIFSYINARDE